MTSDWIAFAQIGRPHGLKGAFFLKTTDQRTHWDGYPELKILESGKIHKVTQHYVTSSALVIGLEGITSRTILEPLYLKTLCVHRSLIQIPNEDEYLIADLVGARIQSREGTNLGTLVRIGNFGAQEILEIELTGSKETVLYPFIDKYILSIDAQNKLITLEYLPAFFENKKV